MDASHRGIKILSFHEERDIRYYQAWREIQPKKKAIYLLSQLVDSRLLQLHSR